MTPSDEATGSERRRPLEGLWWSVPAAAVLLLSSLAMLLGNQADPTERGTSYDASPSGFRAVYLLLDELGFPVERSKRPTGDAVRWVLFPEPDEADFEALASWVRSGGLMLLADDSADFARGLGIDLEVETVESAPESKPNSGSDTDRPEGGETRVSWAGRAGRVRMESGGEPIVTIHSLGAGEIWLANRPEFLTNRLLPRSDNAVLACRLAEAMLEARPGAIAFDEFVHGQRDRPGIVELLLRPPALGMTLQGLLLMAVLVWHHGPRFGPVRPVPRPRRRSKEEFLDAMAALLERRGDYAEAFRTAREGLARELEHELGLPGGSAAETIAREAARRRPIDERALLRVLSVELAGADGDRAHFLDSMNRLDSCRDEFFSPRRSPR